MFCRVCKSDDLTQCLDMPVKAKRAVRFPGRVGR